MGVGVRPIALLFPLPCGATRPPARPPTHPPTHPKIFTPPGEYFKTLQAFADFYAGNFTALSAALAAAGAAGDKRWNGTLFAALDAAGAGKAAPGAGAPKAALQYSQVGGLVPQRCDGAGM